MGEPLLVTRNVFLDTGAYEHQRFRFDHAALKKLKELGRVGFLHILSTETVDGEVRQHISKNLENAAIAFGRFQGHAGILESAPREDFKALLRPPDSAKMRESALAVWDSFLKESQSRKGQRGNCSWSRALAVVFLAAGSVQWEEEIGVSGRHLAAVARSLVPGQFGAVVRGRGRSRLTGLVLRTCGDVSHRGSRWLP